MQHTITKRKVIAHVLLAGTLLVTLVGALLAQNVIAQETTTPVALRVSCIPSAQEVRPNTPVTWRATVVSNNPDATIFYTWSGVNITTVNGPAVTTSYGSIGTKEATVTVVSQGTTASATCEVEVKNTATTTPTNNNTNNGNNNRTNQGTPPNVGESQVEEDSPARRQQGEGQDGGQFEQQLQQLAKSVLECTLKNMLGQGLGGLLGGLGGGASGSNPLSSIMGGGGGGLEGILGGLMGGGQAVPVNTVSINDYVKSTTAKETGLPSAGGLFQSPSMDSIAYCLANSVVKYTSEGAARWMNTGYNGNPTYIENPTRYFNDTHQLATEKFLQQYAAKPGFSQQDQTILNQIIQEQQGAPSYLQPGTMPSGQNERWIDQFARRHGDPNSGVITKGLNARADLEAQQGFAVDVAEFEGLVNEGNISKKNPETGDVEVPGIVAGRQAQTRLELPEGKLELADELGEALEALFEAVFSIVPGAILQKIGN